MTGRRLPFPEIVFGQCPTCHQAGELLNVERQHWAVCVAHRLKWRLGSDLFTGWRDESPDVWTRNEATLGGYREVRS